MDKIDSHSFSTHRTVVGLKIPSWELIKSHPTWMGIKWDLFKSHLDFWSLNCTVNCLHLLIHTQMFLLLNEIVLYCKLFVLFATLITILCHTNNH